tara:strand:+ start:605 stop:1546 length:942 start_codon:yes stop_codon:yes gene_type:complete
MNQNHNLTNKEYGEEEIDLREVFQLLWDEKILIISCTVAAAVLSVFYSLSLPNLYISTALLAPTQETEGLGDTLRGYSGLASLAGISLPSSSASNTTEAIEMLSSFDFFKNNIFPNIFLPDLMAVDSWDAKTNTLSYKDDLYDVTNNKWVRRASFPQKTIPSAQESFKVFIENKFYKSKGKETGFLTLSAKHQSPYVAKAWLDTIVYAINQKLREDQKERALLSIEYLNQQIAQTSYAEIRQGLSALIQQETEKLMLIEANEDYVFKLIDPPIVPELKSEPNRAAICILGTIIGGFIALFIALVKRGREIFAI